MKLAIYGDSFGQGHRQSYDTWWTTLLAKKLGATQYDNFSMGGSSLFYSYKIFNEKHTQYDLNIVLVTSPGRYPRSVNLPDNPTEFISSIDQAIYVINHRNLPSAYVRELEDIKGWFLASDDEFMNTVQDLMISDIQRKSPKTILIPCFHGSYSEKRYYDNNLSVDSCLMELYGAQTSSLGISMNEWEEKMDMIGCHFTPETNVILSDIMYNYIQDTSKGFVLPKHIQHAYGPEHYYNKRVNTLTAYTYEQRTI